MVTECTRTGAGRRTGPAYPLVLRVLSKEFQRPCRVALHVLLDGIAARRVGGLAGGEECHPCGRTVQRATPPGATPLFMAPGKYISRQGRDKRGTMAPDFPRGPEGTDQDPASPHPAAGWASSHSSRWRARAVTALLPVGRGDAPAMLGGDAVKARPNGKGGERGRWVCSTCGAPPDGFVLHDQNSRAT